MMIAAFVIVATVAFIFWREADYLKPPRVGRRPQLRMSVKGGRVHFKGADNA